MKRIILIALAALILISFQNACTTDTSKLTTTMNPKDSTIDKHSFSSESSAYTTHLNLNIEVDFASQAISGVASYNIENPNKEANIHFDIDDMEIVKIEDENGVSLPFESSRYFKFLGKKLSISLSNQPKEIHIAYKTKPNAKALQWLNPEQTGGKKYPFLFTQSQAILARSWVPIQDSPGRRITYTAQVKVPKELMAVMSATNPKEKTQNGIYKFEMKQAIPPYLIALAVGDLAYGEISYRTGIYAEPGLLQASLNEFSDMEKMVGAAEALYGAYDWEQFDMIILPPSFPFGGMENPRLTFATPTILAGDKSLTSLVAHELAHSWSGNLVTNATWDDFWLNEGFTVYFERRIMEALYGNDYAEMLAHIGYQDLLNTLQELGEDNVDTRLKLDLSNRNPDDGVTDIAYEKGYFLVRLLEESLGRESFDLFLNEYFGNHKFQSKTTEGFLTYLYNYFEDKKYVLDEVNPKEWIYETGLPSNCPKVVSKKFENVDKRAIDFLNNDFSAKEETTYWTAHEWLHFLRQIPNKTELEMLKKLDHHFAFTNSKNSEILCEWFKKCIPAKYEEAFPAVDSFLSTVGRRKFLVPLYKSLLSVENGDIFANEIYLRNRKNYHSVATASLDELLDINN